MTIALSLKGGLEPKLILLLEKGEYSLTELTLRLGALLLPPIPEGVIGVKPRGDTREKHGGGPFVLKSVRGELFSALKSSGRGSIFMKSQV